MSLVVAIAAHVLGTVISYAMGTFGSGRIVDAGHAMFAARPHLRPAVEALTLSIPFFAGARKPWQCTAAFVVMTAIRGACICLTVLPPLLPASFGVSSLVFGHGYDYIFSGHAAFAASWILGGSRGYFAYALGILQAIGLVATRMHYTVDVFIAWILSWFIASFHPPRVITLRYIDNGDAESVATLRHAVYAKELGHFEVRQDGRIPEDDDPKRVLIGAFSDDVLVGYVGVTTPGGKYSLEKYGFARPEGNAYELRALCVDTRYRREGIGKMLVRAALKFIKSSGGTNVVAMAREQLVDVYASYGMRNTGGFVWVGDVAYFLVAGWPREPTIPQNRRIRMSWKLPFPETTETPCFHGGASLATIEPSSKIISADVLDAWYDPSPAAIKAATRNVEWMMRTSPPTGCEPLIDAIAEARGTTTDHIAVGAGSSDLIFRCFSAWLSSSSRVLLVEPTYGEYSHVLRNVIGCTVDSFELRESEGFRLNAKELTHACGRTRYDLVVIVNPNSPFGTHHPALANVVSRLGTRVWIDETYSDYVGHTLERVATESTNVVVCKSMSKVYALSGCRVGYVCGHPSIIRSVRSRTPPWIVSRPSQAAAIAAIRDAGYYAEKIRETHDMRKEFERLLATIPGVHVLPGCANWTLVKLPCENVADIVTKCAERGVYIRDALLPGGGYCRIAVKREAGKIFETLRDALV